MKFEKLVNTYQGVVFSLAYSILLDADEALDITQEVFIKAWQEPRFIEEDFAHKAWLLKVCRNSSLNSKRKLGRLIRWVDGLFEDQSEDLPAVEVVCEVREQLRSLSCRLQDLSLAERELLAYRALSNASYQEISDQMGLPIGTVMSRLARIRGKLKR